MKSDKTAVVLFNLGGPNNLESVKPFLFNLFNDKAIISLPQPFRWMLAKLISSRRAPIAKEIYEQMGGKSTIIEETDAQAKALEKVLKKSGEYKVFFSMRYWHPMSEEIANDVKAYSADKIILLPLYPQYSTTTTASSIKDWNKAAKKVGLNVPTQTICCYPAENGYVKAYAKLVKEKYDQAKKFGKPRVLFSAHGIPLNRVESGDPYQWQVEKTSNAIVDELSIKELDHIVCYQSKVGPLEWLSPSTEDEIKRAANDKVPTIVVPVAFVSEHSETLVELDIEYKELAGDHYFRVPTVSINKIFIEGLADVCRNIKDLGATSNAGQRLCPKECVQCPSAI